MNTEEINRLEIALAKMVEKLKRAVDKRNEYRDEYQSLRNTDTVAEDIAHRKYCIWQTKSIAAEYGVFQIKETLRCLKACFIVR